MSYPVEGLWGEYNEERDRSHIEMCGGYILDMKESFHQNYPFDYWMGWSTYFNHDNIYASDFFQYPETKGMDWRTQSGWIYVSSIPTTESERKEREPKFKERIAPFIDDFGKQYGEYTNELLDLFNKMKVNTSGLSDCELLSLFYDSLMTHRRGAEIHMIILHSSSIIYIMFEDLFKEILGLDRLSREFNDLMAGFDNKILESDRKLFGLSKMAKELGLQAIFEATPNDDELMSKLEKNEKGKKWLQELSRFLKEYGWRTGGNWTVSSPSWIEKPSLTFPMVRAFMMQDTYRVGEAQKKLVAQREKTEKEILSRVPEDKKDHFTKLMRAAQWAGLVEEDHVFWTENYQCAILRPIIKEMGMRMAAAGALEDPFDVQYLIPDEIEWRFMGRTSAKELVNRRKKLFKEWKQPNPPFCIGDIDKKVDVLLRDPILKIKLTDRK